MAKLMLTGTEERALHRCATALSRLDTAMPLFENGRLSSISIACGEERTSLYLINGEWTTLEEIEVADGEA